MPLYRQKRSKSTEKRFPGSASPTPGLKIALSTAWGRLVGAAQGWPATLAVMLFFSFTGIFAVGLLGDQSRRGLRVQVEDGPRRLLLEFPTPIAPQPNLPICVPDSSAAERGVLPADRPYRGRAGTRILPEPTIAGGGRDAQEDGGCLGSSATPSSAAGINVGPG